MHIFTPFYPGTLTVWMLLLAGFLVTGYALPIYLAQVKSNGDVTSSWLVAVLLCYYMIRLLRKLNVLATNFSYLAYCILGTYLLSNMTFGVLSTVILFHIWCCENSFLFYLLSNNIFRLFGVVVLICCQN
jgi:hypothetical protein